MRRDLDGPDHEAFREVVKAYVKREVIPNQQRWEQERTIGRQAWLAAGKQSIIGLLIPERFGGGGAHRPGRGRPRHQPARGGARHGRLHPRPQAGQPASAP